MINIIVLVGRLTRDPELRKTATGNSVTSFTLAVDNRTKNPDGTKSASFISCITFNQTAENVAKFVRKGSLVAVQGCINQRSYQKRDGTMACAFEILCDSVQFLEPKQAEETPNLDDIQLPDDDEDVPF